MEGGDTGLLKDILSIADAETDGGGGEVSLVEMYRDLMYIAEKLKSGIESALEREQAAKAKRAENGEEEDSEEEEEEEESEEEDEDEDEDEDDEDDDEVREKKAKKPKKPPKPLSDVEKLLDALSLHNQHKQHLLIKKAVLLKFEEVLFGNNNITMTIDLRQLGDEEKDGKLEEILKCKDLTKYMPRSLTENGNSLEFAEKAAFRELVSAAKCPNDILEPFRAKTPKKIAVNLIKQQYNIRWNTKSGESRPFDFYDLPKQFRKGVVRKAHIQTVLYEHKAEIGNIRSILNVTGPLTSEDVCPPFAYVKKDPYAAKNDDDDPLVRPRDQPKFAWQRWTLQANLAEDLGWDFPQELKWIDPRVKTLIKKLCQPVSDDFDPQATPFVMYLLVVNETTSSRLAEQGNRSQIYIGAADDALKPRFLDGDACHCARVCALQRHFSDAETFSPVDGQLLVDFRLLLALARREERALFALKACDDARTLGKELHDLIVQALYLPTDSEIWGPAVNMSFGLNLKEELKKRRKFLPDSFPGADRRRTGKKKK